MAEEKPADCWQVATQAELDEALAAQRADPSVCIHVRGDAEESVLDWRDANHVEPKINGTWE